MPSREAVLKAEHHTELWAWVKPGQKMQGMRA